MNGKKKDDFVVFYDDFGSSSLLYFLHVTYKITIHHRIWLSNKLTIPVTAILGEID